MTEDLQTNAGTDPLRDRYIVGYVAAIKDLLLVELDEIKEA